jgi:hypothetical protein
MAGFGGSDSPVQGSTLGRRDCRLVRHGRARRQLRTASEDDGQRRNPEQSG